MKRDKPPWWLLYHSPSVIPLLPFIAIPLLGIAVAFLLPLDGMLRVWLGL